MIAIPTGGRLDFGCDMRTRVGSVRSGRGGNASDIGSIQEQSYLMQSCGGFQESFSAFPLASRFTERGTVINQVHMRRCTKEAPKLNRSLKQ